MSDFSYDVLPYASYPFDQSCPENLAAIATLFGLQPPDFTSARVLELGSSSGGNIIPLAEIYPDATFLGIDLSEKEVAAGQEQIAELGLENVELRQMSVNDIGEDFGEFDFIIAHGLYSWVDHDTQGRILEVSRRHLGGNGVAFVSFNTLPGWNLVNTVRDLMLFHTRNIHDPATKTAQARSVLNFMLSGMEGNNTPHAQLMRDEMELLSKKEDYYLYHDHLSEINHPLYFYQFMTRAREAGLEYLGDTDIQTMLIDHLPSQVAERLREIKDIVQTEQYMDFFRNRRFRNTLLCHKNSSLNRNLKADVLDGFFIAGDIKSKSPCNEQTMREGEEYAFSVNADKFALKTSSRISKLVFRMLERRRGKPVSLPNLAREVADGDENLDEATVHSHMLNSMNLLNLVFSGLVRLRLSEGRYVSEVPDKPLTTKTIRYQTQRGTKVTNCRHQSIQLQKVEAFIARLLDGTRTVDDIADYLVEQERQGMITINVEQDTDETLGKRDIIKNTCRVVLGRFADNAMLV